MSDHIADVGKMVGARDVLARARCERHWRTPCDMGGCTEFSCEWRKGAEADLAALSAAGWVVEQGWQPIETAPRDGTWIWCWHEEKRWKRVGMRCKASGPRWYYSGTGFNAEYADDAPTHWRPLPAAPQEDK